MNVGQRVLVISGVHTGKYGTLLSVSEQECLVQFEDGDGAYLSPILLEVSK